MFMKSPSFPSELTNDACSVLVGPVCNANVDFIFCTNNGYLLELFNNIPRCVCKTSLNDVCEIGVIYKWLAGCRQCYYVLRSTSGVLLVVDRDPSKTTKILEKHTRVSRFKICDVSNHGQPQLLIWTGNSPAPEIIFDLAVVASDCGPQATHSKVSDYLETAFNSMKLQMETLVEDINKKENVVRRHLTNRLPVCNLDEAAPVIGVICDSLPSTLPTPSIELRDSWQRVHADMWIIVIALRNISDEALSDINVIPNAVDVWEYRYKLLVDKGSNPSELAACQVIPAGSYFYVTVSSKVADAWIDSSISLQFEVKCSDDCVISPVFSISSSQVLRGQLDFFANLKMENVSLRNDFISLVHIHTKTALTVDMPLPTENKLLKVILSEDFRMKKLQKLGRGYFYSDRGPLDGVLVFFSSRTSTQQCLQVWVRELEQLFLFVSGLYDVLPYGSKITS